MTLIAGIDDAGRGPVIGPLVVAGILLHDYKLPLLVTMGVKDSKALSSQQRSTLAPQIMELASKYVFYVVTPKEIDEVVLTGRRLRKLNWLEAKAMAEVIKRLHPAAAYVDASDVLETRFGDHISKNISYNVTIISEHQADSKYPIVSAASILAKTRRDELVARIREKYGDFGSGYSSDPKTRTFLKQLIREQGESHLPNFVRKSWKTIVNLQKEVAQCRLE